MRVNKKQAYLKDFISHQKIILLAVLETHVSQDYALGISRGLASKFTWFFNYNHHPNGRILVGWDSSIWSVNILDSSTQQVTSLITRLDNGGAVCNLVCVWS